ncbi:hypothetical protein EG829_14120, partial [bacterium]|nr:hypothetical protein [bacterium]
MAQQRTSCRTSRALVLVLIVLLLACGNVTAGYLSTLDHKHGITREKQNELLAVADLKSRNSA